jgi:hypothetical protein
VHGKLRDRPGEIGWFTGVGYGTGTVVNVRVHNFTALQMSFMKHFQTGRGDIPGNFRMFDRNARLLSALPDVWNCCGMRDTLFSTPYAAVDVELKGASTGCRNVPIRDERNKPHHAVTLSPVHGVGLSIS